MKSLRFKKHDGGRHDAGFKGKTGDCVTRAIAIATKQGYRKTYNELGELYKEMTHGLETSPRSGVETPVFCNYLTRLGWAVAVTPNAYLSDIPRAGVYIADLSSRHVVTVIDGVVYDTWDSRRSNRTKSGSPKMNGYFYLPAEGAKIERPKTAAKAQAIKALKKIHPKAEIEDNCDESGYGVELIAPPFHSWGDLHSFFVHGDSNRTRGEFWAEVIKEIESLKVFKCDRESCPSFDYGECDFWAGHEEQEQ